MLCGYATCLLPSPLSSLLSPSPPPPSSPASASNKQQTCCSPIVAQVHAIQISCATTKDEALKGSRVKNKTTEQWQAGGRRDNGSGTHCQRASAFFLRPRFAKKIASGSRRHPGAPATPRRRDPGSSERIARPLLASATLPWWGNGMLPFFLPPL